MRNLKQIAKIVKTTLADDFGKNKIVNVRVSEDTGSDDEPVLRIDVIFEGMPKDMDARKLSGAVRHVRPQLRKIGEEAFPLLSFISKSDAGAGMLEPA